MTRRQRQAFDFIRAQRAPVTLRQIGEAIGGAKGSIHALVARLIEQGHVVRLSSGLAAAPVGYRFIPMSTRQPGTGIAAQRPFPFRDHASCAGWPAAGGQVVAHSPLHARHPAGATEVRQ